MDSSQLTIFRQSFAGNCILPDDAMYEVSAAVMFGTGKPALIVRPKTTEAVAQAITFARSQSLPIAVRSGGHSGAALSTNTDGMVIDLSLFSQIELLDEATHRIRVGSGARWVDVAQTLKDYGLALSSGDTKTVGVGGLTLGGGIGWLVRLVGLTVDSLRRIEIVTASGETVTASATENPDLFWALRGGGGNFGIATYFEFEATPLQTVFSGPILYSVDEIEPVLTGWRNAMRSAPRELNSTALVMPSFAGNPPGAMILACYAGADEAAASAALAPLRKLGKVIMDGVKQKAYADVLEDAHPPKDIRIMTHVAYAKELSNELIAAIVKQCTETIPILQIRYLGGALADVDSQATAFAHRDNEVLLVSPAFVPLTATEEMITQANKPWSVLSSLTHGTYANLLSSATDEDVHSMYPDATYERLAKIKAQYDPENVFRGNYNIKPQP